MPILGQLAAATARMYSRLAPSERGGYRIARLARRFIRQDRWQNVFALSGGNRMSLDLATYPDCAMAFGLYELDTARLLRRLLKPGDHFIDAGANIGYFSLMAARCVGPTGRVDSFEPQPDNFARLAKHVEDNRLTEIVRLHNVALTAEPGMVQIHQYVDEAGGYNHGCSSLFADPDAKTSPRVCDVQADRLDTLLADAQPRVIKLDVEGAESLVVSGATKLLQQPNPPAIVGEFNPSQAGVAGVPGDAWVHLVMEANESYQMYAIGAFGRLKLLEIDDLSHLSQTNLAIFSRKPVT